MRRDLRLRSSAQFDRVYQNGRRVAEKDLVLYFLAQGSPVTRVGISVNKKVGNAVERNRVKRRIRAIVDSCAQLGPGFDLVFVAKPIARIHSFDELKSSVLRLLGRAEIVGARR